MTRLQPRRGPSLEHVVGQILEEAGRFAASELAPHLQRYNAPVAAREALERVHTAAHIDAIFAADDASAVGALSALRKAGRRVPESVRSVDTANGEAAVAPFDFPLAAVAPDLAGIGCDFLAGMG